jgi:DNA-directed RNA polymerase specialized sigma24 family protein
MPPRSPAVDEAVRLVLEEGLTQAQAAARAGCTRPAVFRRLNPDQAQRDRIYNQRRAGAKREWAEAHDRPPCPRCGQPMAVGAGRKGFMRCRECRANDEAARRALAERMWREGAPVADIAAAMSWSPGSVQTQIARWRADGAGLPDRRRRDQRAVA